jgi:prepilin-type N-terminal cleavage/methylation domain-containing protein
MKTQSRRHPAAFTLIELMAVITIIVILAGLVVGGLGYVNEKQAREKANIQIALLSKALEEYKMDMGIYPPTDNKPGPFTASGTSTSATLFKVLYLDGLQDTTKKIYVPELDPVNSKQGWTTGTASTATKITDPWGNEYCYRSAINAAGGENAGTQNPDFDLWSMGKDGKTSDTLDHKDNRDDIRNF